MFCDPYRGCVYGCGGESDGGCDVPSACGSENATGPVRVERERDVYHWNGKDR